MSSWQKYRADVFALLAYLVLAILLTYPLVLHFTTHVPGDGSDDPALAWNLWWVPYSIINLGKSPIYTDYMFYPIGLNLAFYTLTYLNAFLSIPIQYAFNLIVATNINVWFSFVVGGYGVYLLVRYILRVADCELGIANLAAFVAGVLYAFSANKFLYVSLGQFNIASSHWIPFYVLFLLKLTRPRIANSELRILNCELRLGFLLGLFLLFQALSEFIFASFLIIFTAIYLVYWLIATRPKLSTVHRSLFTFLAAILTFTIPMLPILAAMIQDMLTEGDFIQQGLGFADTFSSDVLGFFVPSHLNPVFGTLEAQFHFPYTNFAYLGFAVLALALIALWKIPPARIWGIFGAIFVLISLGPALSVNGTRFDLPMPFDILLEIPFVKGNRYPSRWSVMVTLALAVMVGYGVAWLWSRVASRRSPVARFTFHVLLLAILLSEHVSSLPLSDFRIPDVYKTIAQDQGDFTVLEIPLAWRNGFRMTGTLDTAMMFAQWYQTEHHHPILGGNTSRNPELKFQYFTEAPVINSIIAVETAHKLDDATIQRDKQLAPDVLRFFGTRYVVWHSPRNPANRAALDAAREYIETVLPITKFYDATDETGQTIAYRVNEMPSRPLPGAYVANGLVRLFFAEGWGTFDTNKVWATRREARVFLRLDKLPPAQTALGFSVFSPVPEQQITIKVNGNLAGSGVIHQDWGWYGIQAPENIWRVGMNEVIFRFDKLVPVSAVLWDNQIGNLGVISPASIVVRSAGGEIGDFAHIYVNGVDASPNLRGYNVVVINEKIGAVEASAAFDTFASEDESARFAQFIAKIPNGRIVAVAVRDEASRHLTPEAVDALQSIGAKENLRGKFRWSHAIIGVKGAPPGSAREIASEMMPAQLVVGIGATEPNVAAAIEWIRIEPK